MIQKNVIAAYHHSLRGITLVFTALAFLLVFSACTKQETKDEMSNEAGGQMENPPATTTPAPAPPMTVTEADTIEVSLMEADIDMPTALMAGPTVFMVTNTGTEKHGFKIEGQGMEEILGVNLLPGDTSTLFVDLQPGAYTVSSLDEDNETADATVAVTVNDSGAI